jgi:ABC-2 type transport system ATP-binding protein
MILTSHYMEDIERMCERIIIIREGEFVFDGPLKQVVERYAKHKVVTAHMTGGNGTAQLAPEIASLGQVLEFDDLHIKLQVPRQEVAAAASSLLERYAIADLTIEEEDVGAIIEKIMRSREEDEP